MKNIALISVARIFIRGIPQVLTPYCFGDPNLWIGKESGDWASARKSPDAGCVLFSKIFGSYSALNSVIFVV